MTSSVAVAQAIDKIKFLLENGIINELEFKEKKAQIIEDFLNWYERSDPSNFDQPLVRAAAMKPIQEKNQMNITTDPRIVRRAMSRVRTLSHPLKKLASTKRTDQRANRNRFSGS